VKQTTKTIWDDAIEDYKDYGFNIELPDNELLALYFKDKLVAKLWQSKVTVPFIRQCCESYLKSILKGE